MSMVRLEYVESFQSFLLPLAMVHVYVRADGLASVIVSDSEYPQRVAHTLISKVRESLERSMRVLYARV